MNWEEYKHCPICGEHRIMNCKCSCSESTCPNDHTWHYCMKHDKRVIGESDHSKPSGECQCNELIGQDFTGYEGYE